MPKTSRVAVIGAGRMGSAMVRRLSGQGMEVVVYNRTRSRAEEAAAAGAQVASSLADALREAEVAISSLADDRAVMEVFTGDRGVATAVGPGTVVVETSTTHPETKRRVGREVTKAGAAFLDAPVSGSVPAVEAGALMIMASGDPAALDRARPVLELVGNRIHHLGEVGSGAAMKLAVNHLVHAINVALAEGLVLAERAGVPREAAYQVFSDSAGAAPYVGYKRNAFLDPEGTPVAFTLQLVAKDLELITRLADELGVDTVQGDTNLAVVRAALEAGWGERDMSWLAEVLRGSSPLSR